MESNKIKSLKPVTPTNPPAPYVGGKRLLANRIIEKINKIPHGLYAEPFIGMGGVFLRRNLCPEAEVINDRNKEIANLFRILQRHFPAFVDVMKFAVSSRSEFERLSDVKPESLTDLERAARFLYLQKLAFGGKPSGRNFGVTRSRGARFNLTKLEPELINIHQRLASVVIECLNYDAFIKRYDQPSTLFYLDPPYWNCEDYYGKDMFSKDDFMHLSDLLKGIKGRFIMSLNDTPEIREIFKAFHIEKIATKYSIKGEYMPAKEVLIYN